MVAKRAGPAQRLDEELVGRPVAAAGELLLTEREPEPAETDAVEPAERAEQQLGGDGGVQLDRAELDTRNGDQLTGGEVVAERSPRDAGACRHLGNGQRSREGRDVGAGAHHDRHARSTGTPSRRCCSRSRRASRAASAGADDASMRTTGGTARSSAPTVARAPSPWTSAAAASRCTPAAAVPMRSVTRAVSSRRALSCRCAVPSTKRSTGTPSRASSCPSADGSAPRKSVDATSGSPNAIDGDPPRRARPQERDRRDGRLLQVVDEEDPQTVEGAAATRRPRPPPRSARPSRRRSRDSCR